MGQHGEGSQITAEEWDIIANVRAWHANLRALVGTIVSVIDNYATTTTDVLILDVQTNDKAILKAGAKEARGVATLRVVKVT